MRATIASVLALAACAPQAMLVADVRIEAYDLVVEHCPVSSSAFWTRCYTERQPLPIVTPASAPPRPAGDPREGLYRHLGRAGDGLTSCAVQHQLHGLLQVTLAIDPSGHVASASVEGAPLTFSECAVSSLASIPFATSSTGTRITFTWQVPDTQLEVP